MKKGFLLLSATIFLLAGCDLTAAYGKRVKINDSLEIFVKGNNVTEADGKKLGNFLANLWKDATNMKSLQLSKDSETFVVKMVVDEKMVVKDTSLNESFAAVKQLLETQVFSGSKIKFVITDDKFGDIKSY